MSSIFLLLIFVRPFISSLAFPYLNYIYTLALTAFLLICLIYQKKQAFQGIKTLKFPLLLFFAATIASAIFAGNHSLSLNELYKYIDAILLVIFCASLASTQKNRIIQALIIAGFIISLLAIYQYFFGFHHLLAYVEKEKIATPFVLDYISSQRVFFPFISPNALAGYLILIIPLTLMFDNRVKLIALTPMIFILLLTKSIGAIASLFITGILFIYIKKKMGKKLLLLIGVSSLILILIFFFRQIQPKEHLSASFSFLKRLDYWRETLEIIKLHPFKGIGLGNFNLPISRYAHNSYLQIWAEMGILGIISFFWLITKVIKNSSRNIYLIAAITVFLIHNCVDFTFYLPEISLIWWTILGLGQFRK